MSIKLCFTLHIWVNSSQGFCLSKVIKFVSNFKVTPKVLNWNGSMCSTDLVICNSQATLFELFWSWSFILSFFLVYLFISLACQSPYTTTATAFRCFPWFLLIVFLLYFGNKLLNKHILKVCVALCTWLWMKGGRNVPWPFWRKCHRVGRAGLLQKAEGYELTLRCWMQVVDHLWRGDQDFLGMHRMVPHGT